MAGSKPYRPDYISRKMFDKYQDRLDLRVQRIKEDYRNDISALMARLITVEQAFALLHDKLTDLFP